MARAQDKSRRFSAIPDDESCGAPQTDTEPRLSPLQCSGRPAHRPPHRNPQAGLHAVTACGRHGYMRGASAGGCRTYAMAEPRSPLLPIADAYALTSCRHRQAGVPAYAYIRARGVGNNGNTTIRVCVCVIGQRIQLLSFACSYSNTNNRRQSPGPLRPINIL